ncbi:hypothetical protein N7471_010555 [Penicillium samsonianum]|uniref:uncharacterized protein n=1 Tax=Penicillium samsonianum TaxID=1882272 RepID=UPI002547CC51|nr:uncharacterized protein N7471_010555 [Penicillium samsonianum]KAJ6126062.1 hypothetical protein N7471_010555 [Penicillium samsonianum]
MCLVPISQDLVPTSQDLKHNIKIIRDQINNKIAQKIAQKITEPGVVTEGGWQYGGEPFLQSVETLRTQIQKELKNVKVRERRSALATADY